MYNNNVDWASLAQQWIQMRDLSPQSLMPEAPSPPEISDNPEKQKIFVEQGEADMEVVKEEEDINEKSFDVNSIQNKHLQQKLSIPSMQQNAMSFGKPDISSNMELLIQKLTALPEQWNPWPSRVVLPPPVLHIPPTDPVNFCTTNAIKLSMTSQSSIQSSREVQATSPDPNTTDTSKRKILPAWIREGLEKMEREKQKQKKQESQEKTNKEKDKIYPLLDKENPSSTINHRSMLPESDCSGNEGEIDLHTVEEDCNSLDLEDSKECVDTPNKIQFLELKSGKSYEQKLSELMIIVRRTLTELLLEVTNEEITNICQEAIKYQKTKASSVRVIRKSALLSLTGKLGLAAYADSSSERNSSSSGEDSDASKNSNVTEKTESEEEIKAKIRLLRRTFCQTSEEIEKRIAENELREEQKLKYYMERETIEKRKKDEVKKKTKSLPISDNSQPTGKSFEKDFGETPDTKFHQSNGKRQKERLTRFSDNKDSRKLSHYISSQATTNNAPEVITQGASSFLHSPPSHSLSNSKTMNVVSNQCGVSNMPSTLTMAKVLNSATKKTSPLTSFRKQRRKSSRDTSSTSSNCSHDTYRRSERSRRKYSKKSSKTSSRHKPSAPQKDYNRDHKYSRKKDSYDFNEYETPRNETTKYSSKKNCDKYDDSSRSNSRYGSRSVSRSRSRSSYSSSRRKC